MRPGRIRPGNWTGGGACRRPGSGFNEAGADPPRKPCARWDIHSARPRFNEAGADPPRKQQVIDLVCGVVGEASMRPGRIRPGNLLAMPRIPPGPPGFNEAGADPPRKHLPQRAFNGRLREPRFNEAGADPPRKLGAALVTGDALVAGGFNEAGADPPRKRTGLILLAASSAKLQ